MTGDIRVENTPSNGGGIDGTEKVTVTSSVIAGNDAFNDVSATADEEVSGVITSGGHNLFGVWSNQAYLLKPGDLSGDPSTPNALLCRLSSLQMNGGPTDTLAVLVGSPVIGAEATRLRAQQWATSTSVACCART